MAWIVDYKMDLSDMDPLEVGELLSGLTEYDFQLWGFPTDVRSSWTGMTQSWKASLAVQWLC